MNGLSKVGILPVCTLTAFLFLGTSQRPARAQDAGSANAQNQPSDQFPEQYPDAEDGNLAPENGAPQATNPAPAPQQPAPSYSGQQPPPPPPTYAESNQDEYGYNGDEYAQTTQPPPPLPTYTQPLCPGPGYMWTPGYWYWGPAGYYWVPGAWVMAPWVGALWTPGYWGWSGVVFRFYPGYWGPYIGFYGGVNYGWGYPGRGYYGGYWHGRDFYYNRSVTRVNITIIHNTYNRRVVYRGTNSRVSYNGGHGGLTMRPTSRERIATRDRRSLAVGAQTQHMRQAASNHRQFASTNKGRPATLAVSKPLKTSYRQPAARAPEARFTRPANQVRPEARPQSRPQPQLQNRPAAQNRQEARPQSTPDFRPQNRPAMQSRPEARPQSRPEPRTQPRSEIRPANPAPFRPQAQPRPQPQREAFRQQPQSRPQPQREAFRQQPRPHQSFQRQQQFHPQTQAEFRSQPRPQFRGGGHHR